MRIVLVSRYPRADFPSWKRDLAARLLEMEVELGVLYSRAPLTDHLRAAMGEVGLDVVRGYRGRRSSSPAAASRAVPERRSLAAWARRRGIPVMLHRGLGDPDCADALRAFRPDLVVLAGADIVPAALLGIPAAGSINPHYGLLPKYRGMNVTEWSIHHDDPVGVTIHDVSPGIDTGDILLQEAVRVEAADTLPTLRRKHQDAAARLLVDAVARIRSGTIERRGQADDQGRQYYRMHPLLLERVERKLRDGSYRWIGEEPPELMRGAT